MENLVVKEFLDACHMAKRITELMPELPKGMSPRHVHVIDAIWNLEQSEKTVKVSDISAYLNVTRPSITKLINELEKLNVVQKIPDEGDGRIIRLKLTELGEQYYDYYIRRYHLWLSERFADADISTGDLETTIRTVTRAYKIMSTCRMEDITE